MEPEPEFLFKLKKKKRTGHEVVGKHFEFFKNRNRRVLIEGRKEGKNRPTLEPT